MKKLRLTIDPETAAERDAITALKLAVNDYAPEYHAVLFAFGGGLSRRVPKRVIEEVRAKLEREADEAGRDVNGVDIAAAVRALDAIEGI